MNRPECEDDLDFNFAVWFDGEAEESARVYINSCAADAAVRRARADYHEHDGCQWSWPVAYRARNKLTGELFMVEVDFELRPHFMAVREAAIPMLPAVHVLRGDRVLCEDPQLRGASASWLEGQACINLHDFADGGGATAPACDRCAACWKKAPGLVEGLRQIGVRNE